MNNKTYDLTKYIQQIIMDLAAFYCVLDKFFGWGRVGFVESLVPVVIAIIGHILKIASNNFFETKTIVTKITPDKDPSEDEEVRG